MSKVIRLQTKIQDMVKRNVKDGKQACKRPSFAGLFAVFCNALTINVL